MKYLANEMNGSIFKIFFGGFQYKYEHYIIDKYQGPKGSQTEFEYCQ